MHSFIYPSIQQTVFSTYLVVLFIEGLKIGEILGNAEIHEEENITLNLITKKQPLSTFWFNYFQFSFL